MVNRDIENILKWSGGDGNGLDYIVKFIAKLLEPSQPESSAIFVGDLIVQMVRRADSHMVPVLPQLLTAIIHRLSSAKMPSFIQVDYINTKISDIGDSFCSLYSHAIRYSIILFV